MNTSSIFLQNARTLILSTLLSIVSFGVAALMVLMLPVGLVGLIAGELDKTGTKFVEANITPRIVAYFFDG